MPIINQVVAGSGGSAPASYVEKVVDGSGVLVNGGGVLNLTGATTITDYGLYYGFQYSTISTVPNFNSITILNKAACCTNAFLYCTSMSGVVDMENVTAIQGSDACMGMFFRCSSLTGIKPFKKLERIGGTSSHNCMKQMFVGCTGITGSVEFESLAHIFGNNTMETCFRQVPISSIWFYALQDVKNSDDFKNMLQDVTDCTVHFPIAIQSSIGSFASVTAGFGGTNTTVLYDIVTSLTGADSNTYTRQEKDSTSTATAWVYNDTLYYTSGVSDNTNGVNEPSVSDAIYSDAACTQSVTTITAIA